MAEILLVEIIRVVAGFMHPNGNQLGWFMLLAKFGREKRFERNVILVS